MFTPSDVDQLRQKGTTNRQILEMTSRVVPSARQALKDMDSDKNTPDAVKESIMQKMIDGNAKKTKISGLPYVTALGLNSAQKKNDKLMESYQNPVQFTNKEYGTGSDNPLKNAGGMIGNFAGDIGQMINPANIADNAKSVVGGAMGVAELGAKGVVKASDSILKTHIQDKIREASAMFPNDKGPIEYLLRSLVDTTPEQKGVIDTAAQYGITSKGINIANPNNPNDQTMAKGVFEHPLLPSMLAGGAVAKSPAAAGIDSTIESATQKVGSKIPVVKDYLAAPDRAAGVQQLVQPKMNAAELKRMAATNPELIQEGAKGAGIIKNANGPTASLDQKSLAQVAESIPGFGEDYNGKQITPDQAINNAVKVTKQLQTETQALDAQLEKNNFTVPHTESIGTVKNALKTASEEMGLDPGVYQAAGKKWEVLRKQYPGNATGERAARIAFDDWAENKYGAKIFEKGTSQADAVRAVRQTSNMNIEKYAQKNGFSYQQALDRLSSMYDIRENLASHVTPDIFKSTVSRLMKKPLVKAGMKAAGLGAAATVIH